MTVAVLNSYSGADALSIEQRPLPSPGRDEVLVKVAFSPINPSDLATLKGHYGFKDPTPIPNNLKSEIRKIYPLQEVKAAIHDYASQMTGGKILLSMS